ncbi:MAG: flagellar basal body protein [Planctomycetota bacterium]|nr:flagellar basal body protein [Planctomycetota bacterium]
MSINGLTDSGALPAIEAMARFTAARQRLIANNVANLDTPGYSPMDADPRAFQAQMGRAIDARRDAASGTAAGPLALDARGPMTSGQDGQVTLNPAELRENLLFHDRNDRNLERIMQDVSENLLAFQAATQLLRNRFRMIEMAISERI